MVTYDACGSEAFRETHSTLEGAVKRVVTLFPAKKRDAQLSFETKISNAGEKIVLITKISVPVYDLEDDKVKFSIIQKEEFTKEFDNPFALACVIIEKLKTSA
jgi:hypothetical protein